MSVRIPGLCSWPSLSNQCTVTELLGTDLHRLLTSRPLEKQFIQYFLYQILVCHSPRSSLNIGLTSLARPQIRSFRRCRPPRSQTLEHPRKRKLRPQDL